MGEVFLDAFLDTLKVLPFLLIMNFLIELIEYKSGTFKANKTLKGGLAPLIGTAVGVVPQCGFSVVATELYSKRKIALGTLLAVYIATSDEALPIMLSSYEGVTKVLPVMIIKVIFALVVGYSVFGAQKLLSKSRDVKPDVAPAALSTADGHSHEIEHDIVCGSIRDSEHSDNAQDDEHVHIHGCHHHSLEGDDNAVECENPTKKQKAARVWRLYLKHPIIHTATVIFFILIVNIVFGITVYYVGEDRLAAFIGSTGYLQPVLAAAVGLIPNCAASVVITELYVVGGLNLGGAVAGLCVSAGIGYAVLVKQNRPLKFTVVIIAAMYVVSVALGMVITVLPQWLFGL